MEKKTDVVSTEDAKPKVIYYFDALCGWCYGFSPVMSKLAAEYGEQLEIEAVSGGLFLGARVGDINEVAPYIKAGAYKSVESRTGVKFGPAFLEQLFGNGSIVLNSLPPAIALCILKEKYPEQGLRFASMLLKAIYFDGLNPIDVDGLASYAGTLGFDKEDFKRKMSEERYRVAAEKEFARFSQSRFSGMPALVLENKGQQFLLSHGYTRFEELEAKLKGILA